MAANHEDLTLSPILDLIIINHDSNIGAIDVQDPQVALLQDEYRIWADEMDATVCRECEYMFKDDNIVSPSVLTAFLISSIVYRIFLFPLDVTMAVGALCWHIMNPQITMT